VITYEVFTQEYNEHKSIFWCLNQPAFSALPFILSKQTTSSSRRRVRANMALMQATMSYSSGALNRRARSSNHTGHGLLRSDQIKTKT
jgi:hypothetical protein